MAYFEVVPHAQHFGNVGQAGSIPGPSKWQNQICPGLVEQESSAGGVNLSSHWFWGYPPTMQPCEAGVESWMFLGCKRFGSQFGYSLHRWHTQLWGHVTRLQLDRREPEVFQFKELSIRSWLSQTILSGENIHYQQWCHLASMTQVCKATRWSLTQSMVFTAFGRNIL